MDFRIVFKFVEFSVLCTGEVLTGKRCAGAVHGRLKVIDEGTVCHRGEGKAIINGCTDIVKKSYRFTMTASRRVSECQE